MTQTEDKQWWHRQHELAKAAKGHRERNLQAIESTNELESDEFFTARQKAEAILKQKPS